MKRETSKEKEALLALKERPARERSPFSASTNPPAPTSPSRQFHSRPSISLRRRLLAVRFCSTARRSRPAFSSRHPFWNRFFLSSTMTRSKAEACSSAAGGRPRDCPCEATVDSSSPFSASASSSFSSRCFRACWAAISRLTRSSSLAWESQAAMLLNSGGRWSGSASLACSICCSVASRLLISFCSRSIFSSKEQMKGTNSSSSSPACASAGGPSALSLAACSSCSLSASTSARWAAISGSALGSAWISCFCRSTNLQREAYSWCIQAFSACRQFSLQRSSSLAPPSSSSSTDSIDISTNRNYNTLENPSLSMHCSPEFANLQELILTPSAALGTICVGGKQQQMENEFERRLAEGCFKNSPEFIQDDQNLHRLVAYLEKARPRPEVMDILLALLKFFRFPIALCCAPLYRHLSVASPELVESCRERACEVAAYVRSLVVEMGVGMFAEIEFFQKWGQAKKKFKVNVSEREREFGSRILEMSSIKQALAASKEWGEDTEEKINAFLSTSFQGANVFEEKSIEIMKSSGKDIINSLFIRREEQERPEQPSRRELKSAERREVEKPRRAESIPVHHEPSLPSRVQLGPASEVKGICCRTSFKQSEVVDQPQSLRIEYKYYAYPFRTKADEVPSKRDKIKRTLCGFLNAEGGTIYFGIRELPNSRQRLVNGMVLSESSKKDFGADIAALMREVLPDVGKKWSIKYVPVKDGKKGNYITGCYVVKVTVERGSKDQVYSYLHETYNGSWIERFAFRTENQILEISEIQRVLKIFKNKVQSPERSYYPAHPFPCPEPELGKPLYEQRYDYDDDNYEYEKRSNRYEERKGERNYDRYEKSVVQNRIVPYDTVKNNKDFPPILSELREEGSLNNWHDEEDYARIKKFASKDAKCQKDKDVRYMQKGTDEILLNVPKVDLEVILVREGIPFKMAVELPESPNWTYLQLERAGDKGKLIKIPGEIMEVYPRISTRLLAEDQLEFMDNIIQTYRNKWNMVGREVGNNIVVLKSSVNACIFYLKMREMGLSVEFTPLT